MDKGLITEVIRKFLEGRCSDEEFAYLLYWYEMFDENLPLQLTEDEESSLRANILKRIHSNIPEIKRLKKDKDKRKNVFIRGWKYAAAAVLIGVASWVGVYMVKHNGLINIGSEKGLLANEWVSQVNHSSQLQIIVFPDGSKGWLNPGSNVRYRKDSFSTERKVELTGEAFFDIRHDVQHPFEVVSQNMIAKVLGTSFFMRVNPDGLGKVTVLSGKVAVERRDKQDDKVILVAKQSVVLNAKNKLVKETVTDESGFGKWKQINLSFDNVPLSQAIQVLNKKFDVQIFCQEDKIYHYHLKADFNSQNLADILTILEMSLNIHYKMINDSTISFYEKH